MEQWIVPIITVLGSILGTGGAVRIYTMWLRRTPEIDYTIQRYQALIESREKQFQIILDESERRNVRLQKELERLETALDDNEHRCLVLLSENLKLKGSKP